MKAYQTETYGIPFVLSVPSTLDEYAAIHGSTSAVLDNAISNDVNHVILGKIRGAFANVLVDRGAKLDTTTNAKGETVDVKPDKKWFAAALASLGIAGAEASKLLQSISDSIGYDISSSRGLNGGPAQKDLSDAEALCKAIEAGQSTYDRVKSNLEGRNPGLEIETDDDGVFSVEALAKGLAFERRRIEAERKQGQTSLLG
jgi:hypothetical protein